MKKIVLITLLLITTINWFGFLPPTLTPEKQTVCWKIQGNGLKKPSYLFGTLHTAKQKLILQNPTLNVFLHQVDAFTIERLDDTAYINHFNPSEYLTQPLRDLLSAKDYNFVSRVFYEDARLDINALPPYSPIFLMEQFMTSPSKRNASIALDTTYPILSGGRMEAAFIIAAKSRHLPLFGLETYREQDSMNYKVTPAREQAICLLKFINDYSAGVTPVNIKKCYMQEDLNCVCKTTLPHFSEYYDSVMRVGRNFNFMKRLPAMIQKQSTFIAVGTKHLCGANGLVALLRKKGYILTPCKVWNP